MKTKVLLINVPHTAIGSRMPREQLPPLGLLSIGGPLIDAGHEVSLLDAEFGPMPMQEIIDYAVSLRPDFVLLGHSGSTSAHVTIVQTIKNLKQKMPWITIIYGGVFPTYHWQDVLAETKEIDFVVRGEGEHTTQQLIRALLLKENLFDIPGIAFKVNAKPYATTAATMITNLDDYRVGWELIDHSRYSYWGNKRAVVVQFSRGCPYLCNYCGQRGFWTKWRHRNPVKFAKELAWLHREHGVELINFADELPTGSRRAWKAFLEALIAENVDLTLVGSTRAGDIVRDADILHLYKKAGVTRLLLGIESYDESTLAAIKKGADTKTDQLAIELMRKHNIISLATYVVGFEEERDIDYWHSLRHLIRYDPDQIQMLYVTPHRWTPYFETVKHREVIQQDLRKWDYKHQVLATKAVPPWRVFVWVKSIEMIVQLRPKAVWRMLKHQDKHFLHGMRWYYKIGRRVFFHEVFDFICTRFASPKPTLEAFWGKSLEAHEYVLSIPKKVLAIKSQSSNKQAA